MAVNTRFCTGIHTLILLAAEPDVQQTSDEIARKLNTNPVVIRRVLSLLRQAGLVSSQEGSERRIGKAGQERDKAIRLGDVYRALEPVSDLSWLEPHRGARRQSEWGAGEDLSRRAAGPGGGTRRHHAKPAGKKIGEEEKVAPVPERPVPGVERSINSYILVLCRGRVFSQSFLRRGLVRLRIRR